MSELATESEGITREVTVDAPLEEVWEAISSQDGRERWLEPDPDRTLIVEETQPPTHISWWWWHECDDEPARHVDIQISPAPDGTRVIVTETQPALIPLARLVARFAAVCA